MKTNLITLLTILGLNSFFCNNANAQYPGLEWAFSYGTIQSNVFGSGMDGSASQAIVVDEENSIYVCGTFLDTVDFNPSNDETLLYNQGSIATTNYLAKYSSTGTLIWARCFDSYNYHIYCNDIAISNDGNIYITGSYAGIVDFDGGPDLNTIDGFNAYHAFVCKYDTSGNFVWVASLGGTNTNGYKVITDKYGNVYSSGHSQQGGDFDPGIGVASLSELHTPYISKLNSNGEYVWAMQINGDYGINDIATDTSGNLIVAGSYEHIYFNPFNALDSINLIANNAGFILKLSSDGSLIWRSGFKEKPNTSSQSYCSSIAINDKNEIYVTGRSSGTVDFNPISSDTLYITASSDMFFGKIDSNGNLNWIKSLVKTPGNTTSQHIAIDNLDNIYISGYYNDTVDLDPSSNFHMLNTGNNYLSDYGFVSKYDEAGSFVWAFGMNYLAPTGGPKGIVVASDQTVFITGIFFGTNDFDPTSTVYNLTTHSPFYTDAFVMKLNQNSSGQLNLMSDELLRCYPNPTNGKCYVEWGHKESFSTLNVYDIFGNLIQTQPVQMLTSQMIDLPNSEGIYLVQLVSQKGFFKSTKVLKLNR